MFVQKKASGKISVQVIDTSGNHNLLLKTIGSTANPDELSQLKLEANNWIASFTVQKRLSLGLDEDKVFIKSLKDGQSGILPRERGTSFRQKW